VQVRLGGAGPILTPTVDESVTGFSLAVDGDGQFHHHLGYTLLSPAADGVYLMEMELWSSAAGIAPSRPFWMVFNQNADQEVMDDAAAWALANVQGCPADVNADLFVDAIDYDVFIAAFIGGDPSGDFNLDGFVDAIDYDRFIVRFLSGC
jgi:hypothetical protein